MSESQLRPTLAFSERIGRTIRQDDVSTLGTSTQTLAEAAMERGDTEAALALTVYFRQEMQTMHNIMITWLEDIITQLLHREGATSSPLPAAIIQPFKTFALGAGGEKSVKEALAASDFPRAVRELDHLRLEFKNIHDVLVAWVHDLLTYIAERYGEENVFDSILGTYEKIWAPRYERWDEFTPEEKLQLTVEGMRGGHFSGPRRRGDMAIEEREDRYVISFDPCGSGGVLRRGDPESGRGPYPTDGVTREPHNWTWGKVGVHWYCVHCPIALEVIPLRKTGRPMRPLDHNLDPFAPCVWNIYKDPARTPVRHYARIGAVPPPEAVPE
jgi:hypothetical protein